MHKLWNLPMNYASILDLWFQRQIETQMISQHLSLIYSANTRPLNRQHNFKKKLDIALKMSKHSDGPSCPLPPLISVWEEKQKLLYGDGGKTVLDYSYLSTSLCLLRLCWTNPDVWLLLHTVVWTLSLPWRPKWKNNFHRLLLLL